jgi:hypothetical protein
MLADSQTASSQLPALTLAPAWRAAASPAGIEATIPTKLAMKDTVIAATVLSAYLALYIGVGLAGLSAVEWLWAYVRN